MKKLCQDSDIDNCNRIADLLQSEGIRCIVKTRDTPSLFEGKDPAIAGDAPEVWVVQDEDFARAWERLNEDGGVPPEPDVEGQD